MFVPGCWPSAGRALPNQADAEDASQEALLLVSRRITSFEGRSKFTTWLYRLTSNALLDTYRGLKRQATEHGLDPEVVVSRDRTSVLAGSKVDLLEAMERIPQVPGRGGHPARFLSARLRGNRTPPMCLRGRQSGGFMTGGSTSSGL